MSQRHQVEEVIPGSKSLFRFIRSDIPFMMTGLYCQLDQNRKHDLHTLASMIGASVDKYSTKKELIRHLMLDPEFKRICMP